MSSDSIKTAGSCRGAMPSTSMPRGLTSGADWIVSATPEVQTRFLDDLGEGGLLALPFLFEFWALPHQVPPDGDWRSWVILGGRGAGKTRAGAEWVRAQVEGALPLSPGRARRVALIGETYDQVRDVMVMGDSGILAASPPDRRPRWRATERKLVWPNGAEAKAFSAHDPEALRGPQFDAAWADELAKWPKAQATWDMLQFCLRLGSDPRACVTTTPRNVDVLKDLLAAPTTVTTHAPTHANRANLADAFLAEVRRRYAGTRLGQQELEGALLDDVEGALWTTDALHDLRVAEAPPLDRIVVALDPAVGGGPGSDACGLVVAGAVCKGSPDQWRAYVLADLTVAGVGPTGWARAAIAAMRLHKADRLVAEVNQGGKLVEEVIRQVDPLVPYRAVHATRGKAARAEPVASLYEQKKVHHLPGLAALERQMVQMTGNGFRGTGSPDRVDALVWAIHDLIIAPAASYGNPGLRSL